MSTMSSPAAKMKKTPKLTPRNTMRGHTEIVFGVAHLPGEQHIITCSGDSSLRLWDLESGAQIGDEWRDEGDEAKVITMALSPNGKTLASGSSEGTVRVWDIETRKVIAKWEVHTMTMMVCWSPDGERVASGSDDGTVWVWDIESREPVRGLNPIKTGSREVYALSYSPEATMIATGGFLKNGIEIWDARTGKLLSTIKIDRTVWCLTWTSDQKKLIAGMMNGLISIFDTVTWQEIAVLDEHDDEPVYSLTLFPNDRLLASSSWDKTAWLWNLNTNLPVGPPLLHEDDVQGTAFSADGKLLSTACHDGNAYVWDVQAILKTAGLEDLLSIPDVSINLTPTRYLIFNG